MNSYDFHIGDYYRQTAHLSQEEHYIYRRLIDQYFLTELPISTDLRLVSRKLQLTSDQIGTLQTILEEYFELEDDGWHHDRVKQELERIYGKSEQAREAANRRWDKAKRNRTQCGSNAGAMRAQCENDAGGMLPTDPLTPLPTDPKDAVPNGTVSKPKASPCPYQQIVDLYHEKLPMLPAVKVLTAKRKSHMKARWTNGAADLKFWDDYFDTVATSKFLTGRTAPTNGRKIFFADIDFFNSRRRSS